VALNCRPSDSDKSISTDTYARLAIERRTRFRHDRRQQPASHSAVQPGGVPPVTKVRGDRRVPAMSL